MNLKKLANKITYCYGTYFTDYNELFLLLWIPGEYSSHWAPHSFGLVPHRNKELCKLLSSLQPNTFAVRLTFNPLLPMLYLYFHSIYLFHIIPSSCLSSRPFTGPQQLATRMRSSCCGPVKDPEERHELGITWNKYIERKYKYSICKCWTSVWLPKC